MVRKILLILFSVMMLFTSSCAMKKLLLQHLEIENSIPTKALPSFFVGNTLEESFTQQCSAKIGSALDDMDLISALKIIDLKAPLLWLISSFFFSWIVYLKLRKENIPYFRQHFSICPTVPLYLSQKRLTLYA